MDQYNYEDEDPSEKDHILESDKYRHHAGYSVPIYWLPRDSWGGNSGRILCKNGGVLLS